MSSEIKDFQEQVSNLLIRHRSVLDVMTKLQESSARTNRALTKAVTDCGCVEITALKQAFDPASTLHDNQPHLDTHFSGQLCEHCRDIVTAEIGKNLFYLAALCNVTDISLSKVLEVETDRLNTLGVFNLS
ncbi:DUF1573 domain-containing protein [Brevibacillus laterosporus]|uniref:DUF1573 domain-containing protein n=1 Tax=Brevibacillus laterosporus TaxID=1465 RepID=UPI0018CCB056|nr:DUF1573 domain-containing protein [Brevibacillus laterosporus]MBG9788472.1 hypothetical protein [Brevibacillus laterosporus]